MYPDIESPYNLYPCSLNQYPWTVSKSTVFSIFCIPVSFSSCLSLFRNSCSPVSLYTLYPCIPVSYPCIPVSLYPCIPVSLYPCIPVSLYPCIPVSLYPCIHVSLYPCISVSLYPSIAVSLYPCISVSLYLVSLKELCSGGF